MVVQVRSKGTVVDRLEKLVAGCGGTMVRASELKAKPASASPENSSPAAIDDDGTAEVHAGMAGDGFDAPFDIMASPSENAMDVAVIAFRPLTTGSLKQAVEGTGWQVRKLLSAGTTACDRTVEYVARTTGVESMVIPTEVGDDRLEMLLWFSDAVLVLVDEDHRAALNAIVYQAGQQGKKTAWNATARKAR